MNIHTSKISTPLYSGKLICLAAIDHEKDPEVEARWTNDSEYMRLLDPRPYHPLSAAQVKKKYEAIEKEIEERRDRFYFTVRLLEDDRLLGFLDLSWIEWNHGCGNVRVGIGGMADRGKGYGSEALQLGLRYAFNELNLYRLGAQIPSYNPVALHVFEKAGFVREVCRREALYRDGHRWDMFHLGILAAEWFSREV